MQQTFKFSEFLLGLRTRGNGVFVVEEVRGSGRSVSYLLKGVEGSKATVHFEMTHGTVSVVLTFDKEVSDSFRSYTEALVKQLVTLQ